MGHSICIRALVHVGHAKVIVSARITLSYDVCLRHKACAEGWYIKYCRQYLALSECIVVMAVSDCMLAMFLMYR